MSRIGKKPIIIPSGVAVVVADSKISIKGPKGELIRILHPDIMAEVKGNDVLLKVSRVSKKSSALWGLSRSLVANMVEGVTKGFEKKLEMEGIGYKVNLDGSFLVLQVGFSHPVRVEAPKGISFSVEKNVINVMGIDKELVGEVAARIRTTRPPEPYKGKGIRYRGEIILKKAGKKAITTS